MEEKKQDECWFAGNYRTGELVTPEATTKLSARWQELFWALPSGPMRSKLRALEIDVGLMLRGSDASPQTLRIEKSGPNFWDAYELREGEAFRRVARIALIDGDPIVMIMPGAAMSLSLPLLDAVRAAAVALAQSHAEAQPVSSTPPSEQPGKSKAVNTLRNRDDD